MENCYLYEVTAIEEPTIRAAEGGALPKVVVPITSVLASGRSSAIAAATIAAGLTATTFKPTQTRWIARKVVGDNAS